MNRTSGIRVALAAATLLAQLVLPVAHGFAPGGEDLPIVSDARGATVSAHSHTSHALPHDATVCPACLALHQVRSGVGRAAQAFAISLAAGLIRSDGEPELLVPRTPDLVAAPPRAPPSPLAFA
jgi:hypothetical protein